MFLLLCFGFLQVTFFLYRPTVTLRRFVASGSYPLTAGGGCRWPSDGRIRFDLALTLHVCADLVHLALKLTRCVAYRFSHDVSDRQPKCL